MRVWIPKCGDAIRLKEDWGLDVYPEHRNDEFVKAMNFMGVPVGQQVRVGWEAQDSTKKHTKVRCILAAGTELVFDRVYIRQGMDEFASVTFIVKDHAREELVGERFWCHLDDANRIEAEPTSSGNPVGGFAKKGYKAKVKAARDPSVQEAADKKKRAKEELEIVHVVLRAELFGALSSQPADPSTVATRDHLFAIADEVVRVFEDRGKMLKQTWCPRRAWTRQEILDRWMGLATWSTGLEHWRCVSTRTKGDLKSRKFLFKPVDPYGYCGGVLTFDGFTITTRDGQLVSLEAAQRPPKKDTKGA